jgi:hypothetical protein
MTSLLNLESEDNEKTVKLIDELNSLKDLDDIPKNSSQIAEASGEKNSKDCESVNTSGYATCQQTSNDSINDNKLKNGFSSSNLDFFIVFSFSLKPPLFKCSFNCLKTLVRLSLFKTFL